MDKKRASNLQRERVREKKDKKRASKLLRE